MEVKSNNQVGTRRVKLKKITTLNNYLQGLKTEIREVQELKMELKLGKMEVNRNLGNIMNLLKLI